MTLPYHKIVIYEGKEVSLRYAMDKCEIGHTIEGIDPDLYPLIIKVLEKERNRLFRYGVDDKYGEWRLILLPPHEKLDKPPVGHFLYPYKCIKAPDKIKPLSLI